MLRRRRSPLAITVQNGHLRCEPLWPRTSQCAWWCTEGRGQKTFVQREFACAKSHRRCDVTWRHNSRSGRWWRATVLYQTAAPSRAVESERESLRADGDYPAVPDLYIILAEREGFEPSVEFPLHTLSKRAPSTTRTSLRFRIKKLRTVWNSVAQNPPSNRPLPPSLSESASCERGKGPVVGNCVRPFNVLRSLTAILLRQARSHNLTPSKGTDMHRHLSGAKHLMHKRDGD